jgi:hypothetical protein
MQAVALISKLQQLRRLTTHATMKCTLYAISEAKLGSAHHGHLSCRGKLLL